MKRLLALTTAILIAGSALAAPTWTTDVSKALSQAKKESKMGFVLMGRLDCPNCQATKKLINEGKGPLTAEKFVFADIDVDDGRANAEFVREFRKEKFTNLLPYVVITDAKGKPLASYNGYKNEGELTTLINEANAKAAAAAAKKK